MTSDRPADRSGKPVDPHLLACELSTCTQPAAYFTHLLYAGAVTRRAMCRGHVLATAQLVTASMPGASFFVRPLI